MAKHKHWWRGVMPTGPLYPNTITGRTLANEHYTHERCEDRPNDGESGCGEMRTVCVEWVFSDSWGGHRCTNPGPLLSEKQYYPSVTDSRNPPRVDGGWHYCRIHHPAKVAERRAKSDAIVAAKEAVRPSRYRVNDRERDLAAEAERWYADELDVGEGFCDTACEHHACRLARAVVALHEARAVRDTLAAKEA